MVNRNTNTKKLTIFYNLKRCNAQFCLQVTSDKDDRHVLQGKQKDVFRLALASSAFPHPAGLPHRRLPCCS